MIFILYFGMSCLNSRNKVIDYVNEAVLPFYVLHHPVIVVIAFYTITWDISLGIKFLFVSTAALIATLLLYDLLIPRWNVTRMLFGMKPLTTPKKDIMFLVSIYSIFKGISVLGSRSPFRWLVCRLACDETGNLYKSEVNAHIRAILAPPPTKAKRATVCW
jgi:hypothetical protein